ncbi:hypothetical protein Defa_22790 [Desulfovibrio sp. TH_2024_36128]|uniref:Uncharacterized protein n=1 Tax=Desulfovibrio falkowii TaxID=3136602 RepID=A0ABQ0EB11_9BACT
MGYLWRFFDWSLQNTKTPGAQNRRQTAGIFPIARYYISPHPEHYSEDSPCRAQDARRAQKNHRLTGVEPLAKHGVLKHRAKTLEKRRQGVKPCRSFVKM